MDDEQRFICNPDWVYDWTGVKITLKEDDDGILFQSIGVLKNNVLIASIVYQNTGDFIWIEHLYVTKENRRRGIATELIKTVMLNNPGLHIEGVWKSKKMEILADKLNTFYFSQHIRDSPIQE